MKNVEMEVVKFNNEDVIATSGNRFVWSGLGDSNRSDDTINGIQMFNNGQTVGLTSLQTAVRKAVGDNTITISEQTKFAESAATIGSGYRILSFKNNGSQSSYAAVNGKAYMYDKTSGAFIRI